MTDDVYDEDLEKNSFFELLRSEAPDLFKEALDHKLYILVPKKDALKEFSTLKDNDTNRRLYKRHIVRLEEATDGKINYYNLDNEAISTSSDGQILTLYDCDHVGDPNHAINVRILFEETYFTENGANCKLFCISRPLFASLAERTDNKSDFSCGLSNSSPTSITAHFFPDFIFNPSSSNVDPFNYYNQILFGNDADDKLKAQLDKNLNRFVDRITIEYRPACHVEQLKITVREEFYATLKDVFGHKRLLADKFSDNSIAQLRISTEIYFFRFIHSRLLTLLCAYVRDEESSMNRLKYAASELLPSDWGILPQLYADLPAARKQLSKLNDLDTPYGKLLCLRRTIEALTGCTRLSDKPRLPISTDDLIPPLAFLISKSNIFNWITSILYITDFHFSAYANDELGYCLASFEAAVQFVKDGSMKALVLSRWCDWALGKAYGSYDEGCDYLVDDKEPDKGCIADLDYWECLIAAIQSGDEAAVHDCMNASEWTGDQCSGFQTNGGSESSGEISSEGCHPLCECAQCLIRKGRRKVNYSVHSETVHGSTALHFATLFGQTSMLNYLIRLGGNLEKADEYGQTPLHWACRSGSQSCALLLLHHGAHLTPIDVIGNTPLHCATSYGHIDCAKALLYYNQQIRGSNSLVNVSNHAGETALHIAVRMNHVEIVSILLECGANAKQRSKQGKSAFDMCHNFETYRLLMTVVPVVEFAIGGAVGQFVPLSPKPKSPIVNRANAQIESDELTFLNTANPEALIDLNIGKVDRLLKAIADNDSPLVRYYLGDPTKVADSNCDRCHPLCQCPKCEDLDEDAEERVNVNATGTNGLNALHTAVLFGRLEIMTYLLRVCGADVNWPSAADGRTSLHLAVMLGNLQVIELLAEHHPDVNIKDSTGDTPFHAAISSGNLVVLRFLLEKYGNNHSRLNDKYGVSVDALRHRAIKENQPGIARMLVQYGADTSDEIDSSKSY